MQEIRGDFNNRRELRGEAEILLLEPNYRRLGNARINREELSNLRNKPLVGKRLKGFWKGGKRSGRNHSPIQHEKFEF